MNLSIKELQEQINNKEISVSSLLRTAKIIASKLEQNDFLNWVEKELNGYSDKEKVPDYRIVKGIPQGFNPYRGWIPYLNTNKENQKLISERGVKQPIGALEGIINNTKENSLVMKYPTSVEEILKKGIGYDIDLRLLIDRGSVVGILEYVKNNILDWTIQLLKEGVSDDSSEFSKKEIEEAKQIETKYQINHVENFNGNMGENNIESGNIIPIETFWNKFFWYVIVALIVVIVGNVLSEIIINILF